MRCPSTLAFCLLCAAGCGAGGGGGAGGAGDSSGCPNDLPSSCPPGAPTYAKDIAPLFEAYCASCHTAGSPIAGDRPLATYREVVAQTGVLNQVYACQMPKAGAPMPSLAEREALLTWLSPCKEPDD